MYLLVASSPVGGEDLIISKNLISRFKYSLCNAQFRTALSLHIALNGIACHFRAVHEELAGFMPRLHSL